MELKEPKRKRLNQSPLTPSQLQQPLPVLIESLSGIAASEGYQPVFVGLYNGASVVISNEDEKSSLYTMGYFGKGCFSKAYPSFGRSRNGIPPLIRERQWERRKTWMEQLSPELSLNKSSDSPQSEESSDKVIVINDGENDIDGENDESQLKSLEPRLCDEPVKTVVETLNLSLEEAFFLSFGLGCLKVVNLQGMFLKLSDMWRAYQECKPNFIVTYVAYHYFRAKGWVVKAGAKFGGDFLLYKQGPPFYHASYIVLVEAVDERPNKTKTQSAVTWTKIMALNRIAETAAKEILLCQVQWPLDVSDDDLKNPKVVSKFKAQEVLFRRWVSTNKKDEKDN